MFKELNTEEMMKIEGGARILRDGLIYDATKLVIKKIATTPYETTVTRGGKKYNVKYDGNLGRSYN